MHNNILFCFFISILLSATALSADQAVTPKSITKTLILKEALSQAFAQNPELAASRARASAEQKAIGLQYALLNPMIGVMQEKNMTGVEENIKPMNSWSISQEIMFPAKYFLMGAAQKAKANGASQEVLDKKLEIRKKIITTYYNLFSINRIIELLNAKKETLRQIARTAENRIATGKVSQQDEMKAHVEQTNIENELLMAMQERESLEAMLNALLNEEPNHQVTIESNLVTPKLTVSFERIETLALANSNRIKQIQFSVKEAENIKNLANYGYAPDFSLSYRKPFSSESENAYAISLEFSVPLWFFQRQSSEIETAAAKLAEAKYGYDQAVRGIQAESRSVAAKVNSFSNMIKIYETSLIPQATSMLNLSLSAYRSGTANFIELLDSERSLYGVRITYYRTVAQYVEALVQLEQITGTIVSSLPMGENL